MTPIDIVNAGTGRVRNDPAMMAEYKRIFFDQFGYEPACPTCGDTRDWNLFKNFANGNLNTQTIMSTTEKTFQLKDNLKIYTYFVEDEKTGIQRPVRTYGHLMTEEFAKNYLSIGNEQTLADRKKEFKVLPATETEDEELSALTVTELHALASEKEYPADEWKNLKKADLIVYLEGKELETTETEGEE